MSKFKTFADNIPNMAETVHIFFNRMEDNLEKDENAGYQQFRLFPQCFQKVSSPGSFKVSIVRKGVNMLFTNILGLDKLIGECNTIQSVDTIHRYLKQYCTHLSKSKSTV